MRAQAEWNVDTHILLGHRARPSWPTRSFISSAALLVKVMARMANGETLPFPDQVGDPVGQDPGLARPRPRHHQDRPAGWVTASRWIGLSPSSSPGLAASEGKELLEGQLGGVGHLAGHGTGEV